MFTTIDVASQASNQQKKTKGYFYNLLDWPITGEHFKPNPSTAGKSK